MDAGHLEMTSRCCALGEPSSLSFSFSSGFVDRRLRVRKSRLNRCFLMISTVTVLGQIHR